MDYNEQWKYRFHNQNINQFEDCEIAFLLAENASRRDANIRPYKLWIPTLMGPKQLPKPEVSNAPLNNNIYINDKPCKPVVSPYIYYQNYIKADGGDHEYYYHRWLDHGAELWVRANHDNFDELLVHPNMNDPSYCDSCLTQHPICNITHPCIRESR